MFGLMNIINKAIWQATKGANSSNFLDFIDKDMLLHTAKTTCDANHSKNVKEFKNRSNIQTYYDIIYSKKCNFLSINISNIFFKVLKAFNTPLDAYNFVIYSLDIAYNAGNLSKHFALEVSGISVDEFKGAAFRIDEKGADILVENTIKLSEGDMEFTAYLNLKILESVMRVYNFGNFKSSKPNFNDVFNISGLNIDDLDYIAHKMLKSKYAKALKSQEELSYLIKYDRQNLLTFTYVFRSVIQILFLCGMTSKDDRDKINIFFPIPSMEASASIPEHTAVAYFARKFLQKIDRRLGSDTAIYVIALVANAKDAKPRFTSCRELAENIHKI